MNIGDLESLSKNDLVRLAYKYTVYYKTSSGKGSIANYEKLTRSQLIEALISDRDYRKAAGLLTRLDLLKSRIKDSFRTPEEIMSIILDVFNSAQSYPIPGKYFTFVYYAKTPGLLYDQHPLIACFDITEWGFVGYNFHLNRQRNYTWPEVASRMCMIENEEIGYMKTLNYRVLRQNY